MRHSSLTVRLTVMFMCAVVAVLAVAGFSFNELSRRHFTAIDRQTLVEKLESTIQIMSGQSGSADRAEIDLQLRALLGAHPELTAVILASDGSELFSAPASANLPDIKSAIAHDDIWEWSNQGHMYRGMTTQFRTLHQARPVTLWLILDVTNHMHFFDTLRWWLWIGLILSAVVSAALGWLVARSGLKPLDRVTQIAASMSARSLKERIPLGPVPSELQELISSFNAMLARLDESFVRLSNFSADIAHELRTPINALIGYSALLLDGVLGDVNPGQRDALTRGRAAAEHLLALINDILDLARIEAGKMPLHLEDVSLVDVTQEVTQQIEPMVRKKQLEFVIDVASDCPIIHTDRTKIKQILLNLLSNAVKFTNHGRVTVEARCTPTGVRMNVIDTGIGIRQTDLQAIWEDFRQVDQSRTREFGGTGLGLSITRKLLERLGGSVAVQSTYGEGSTFSVYLPLRVPAASLTEVAVGR